MKKMTIDGNEAVALSAYKFTEVAGIYPITPSSPMAEKVDEWSNKGVKNIFDDEVKVIEMQSEAGAAGLVHGSLQAGCLTTTFTASQGLLLMIPNMYKIAGEMLPCVFHVAARSLSTHALSIFGDHQDIYACRSTGFCMLSSSSVQEASLLSLVAHLSSLKASLPFLHFFDGFRTSHEIDKIDVLDLEEVKELVDFDLIKEFRNRSLNPKKPYTIGTAQNDDVYFQATEARNIYYDNVPDIVNDYMEKINKITKKDYKPFNYYGDSKATKVIVAMGSVCETIKETIDDLNKKGEHLGLITVHLYRPFSSKYLKQVMPKTVTKIAVLDRTKEPGSNGEPLYLDIKSIYNDIEVVGGRYGLSSKNTTPAQIKAVYDMLDNPKHNFTIGIDDDVTNLSLKIDSNYKISDSLELVIYGYGSDGMVSASKSIIKLIGENTDKYVQGYFQYDSKKSGGVTISHLRFNDKPIRSTYYCEKPHVIVVTKPSYLSSFDCYSNLEKNGIFIVNTEETKEEFINNLPLKVKQTLIEQKANVYIIDAFKFARLIGLKGRISTIMESIIMYLFKVMDYDVAKEKMIEYAKNAYFKKGPEIFEANKKAIKEAINYLEKIELKDETLLLDEKEHILDVFDAMNKRMGDSLKVSAFLPNGIFESDQATREKREISDNVPHWIKDNCITCNQCSLFCPHGVIRPFLLSEEEYLKAPLYVKEECIKPIEPNLKDYWYCIGISVKDCTGCGLCVKNCPGKLGNKALIFNNLQEELKEKKQKIADYLFENISDKKLVNKNTIKGSQFCKPCFAFSGACAGCGETPYIKLLTQLLGDNMIISNATGCSSIYGASAPSTPYSIPWASSLFEDNAEYGYGMLIANNTIRKRIAKIMSEHLNTKNGPLYQKWLNNPDDYQNTLEVYEQLDKNLLPEELKQYKDYIISRSIWTIGGDGWAYDIGFSGIDHVLASNDNVNILVLNSEVYSNTGGQASKATGLGAIAAFASSGKKVAKKDLASIAMSYPNVYVAQTSLGANPMQTIKCFKEASEHHGPSIIIAYTPCISHGITGGMENSILSSKLATECGYFPTFRYNPLLKKFTLDSKNVDFNKYEDYLNMQTRYKMLKTINPDKADLLLKENKEYAIEKYEYYQNLEKQN